MSGGRIPKRESQRRRTNSVKPTVVERTGSQVVEVPSCPPDVHQVARDWFTGLAASPQAVFYEPSDWQMAVIAALVLDEWLTTRRATTMSEFRLLASALLATEVDRRRAHIEVRERATEPARPYGEVVAREWKARLGVLQP